MRFLDITFPLADIPSDFSWTRFRINQWLRCSRSKLALTRHKTCADRGLHLCLAIFVCRPRERFQGTRSLSYFCRAKTIVRAIFSEIVTLQYLFRAKVNFLFPRAEFWRLDPRKRKRDRFLLARISAGPPKDSPGYISKDFSEIF